MSKYPEKWISNPICPYCRERMMYVDRYWCCTRCGRRFFNANGYGFEFKKEGDKK